MQPVQIAMSGVTPGTYGNGSQIPSFTVDARGRLTWAANIDIQPTLNVKVNGNSVSSIPLHNNSLNFVSGEEVSFHYEDNGIKAKINLESIKMSLFNGQTFAGNTVGLHKGEVIGNIISDDGTIVFNSRDGTLSTKSLKVSNDEVVINNIVKFYNKGEVYQESHLIIDSYDKQDVDSVPGSLSYAARSVNNSLMPAQVDDTIYYRGFLAYGSRKKWNTTFAHVTSLYEEEPEISASYAMVPLNNNSVLMIDDENCMGLNITKVGVGVGYMKPKAMFDVNGIMRLNPQKAQPSTCHEGMIAVADGVNWNPVPSVSQGSYPVYYNGSTWIKMIG